MEGCRRKRRPPPRMTDIPNVRQQGARLGNWQTKEQARELLAVPDRQIVKGKRDYAFSRSWSAARCGEGTGVLDCRGHPDAGEPVGGRGPPWQGEAGPHRGRSGLGQELHQRLANHGRDRGSRLFRSIRKGGKIGESRSDWAVWSVVTEAAKEIGIENFGAHDLRRTCAKLCRKAGGDLEQIKFLLGHFVDPDHGTVPWVRAGDRRRGE